MKWISFPSRSRLRTSTFWIERFLSAVSVRLTMLSAVIHSLTKFNLPLVCGVNPNSSPLTQIPLQPLESSATVLHSDPSPTPYSMNVGLFEVPVLAIISSNIPSSSAWEKYRRGFAVRGFCVRLTCKPQDLITLSCCVSSRIFTRRLRVLAMSFKALGRPSIACASRFMDRNHLIFSMFVTVAPRTSIAHSHPSELAISILEIVVCLGSSRAGTLKLMFSYPSIT